MEIEYVVRDEAGNDRFHSQDRDEALDFGQALADETGEDIAVVTMARVGSSAY